MALFGNEGVWRDETHSTEMATINFNVIHAADSAVKRDDTFTLDIHHVRGFHGKGFMASVHSCGSRRNGDIFYGTDATAYTKATNQGYQLFDKAVDEFKKEMEKYSALG